MTVATIPYTFWVSWVTSTIIPLFQDTGEFEYPIFSPEVSPMTSAVPLGLAQLSGDLQLTHHECRHRHPSPKLKVPQGQSRCTDASPCQPTHWSPNSKGFKKPYGHWTNQHIWVAGDRTQNWRTPDHWVWRVFSLRGQRRRTETVRVWVTH